MKKTVTEICCGIGGTRAALEAAGFHILESIDYDEKACEFHKAFWGDAICQDITNVAATSIADADLLSAGFPCQPFSTSGYRTGFSHEQGNVFSALLRLIDVKTYKAVFLENVTGLLSNDKGKTFRAILFELSHRFKKVEWITINLLDLNIPQNRPRLIILAHDNKDTIFNPLFKKYYHVEQGDLFESDYSFDLGSLASREDTNHLFGVISERQNLNLKGRSKDVIYNWNLMDYLFDKKIGNFDIYSGRFWGRTGKTTFYISKNQYSHSIGTSMGAAPTFGLDPQFLTPDVKNEIDQLSNWTSIHSEYFVFRLTPRHALRLFGNMAETFGNTLEVYKAPLSIKYKLIGNMFAPDQALEPLKLLINSMD
jgi:DNA-cytosine methyltransferase